MRNAECGMRNDSRRPITRERRCSERSILVINKSAFRIPKILDPLLSTIRVCPIPPDYGRAAQRVAVDKQGDFEQSAERFGGHNFARGAASDHASVFDES